MIKIFNYFWNYIDFISQAWYFVIMNIVNILYYVILICSNNGEAPKSILLTVFIALGASVFRIANYG